MIRTALSSSRAGLLLAAALAISPAQARPLGGTSGAIPYAGHLDQDGQPVNGAIDVEVRLYDSPTVPEESWSFCERLTDVPVSQGSFSFLIGTGTACPSGGDLAPALDANAGELYLGLSLRPHDPADTTEYVSLAQRQVLGSVPFAHHGAPTGDLFVDENLLIGDGHDAAFTDGSTSGYLYVQQGARFSCQGCGANGTLFGDQGWGDLTLQGRVISASGNLHLSPPAGNDVVINDDYRAAGGPGEGAAGLVVEGRTYAYRFETPCPAGMVDRGMYCIDYFYLAGNERGVRWVDANRNCRSAGLRLCSNGEVSDAARMYTIATYPIASGDHWSYTDAFCGNKLPNHVQLNIDQGGAPLGTVNCNSSVGQFGGHEAIGALCCTGRRIGPP